MLKQLHGKKNTQLLIGLLLGVCFGFLLQKGGATDYNVIINQLLLRDFTVVKIMLSAVVVGMVAVHLLRSLGLVELHPKPGSFGASAVGGLIFGAGFALLGYCPGTVAGAAGAGALDALFGGIAGMLVGAGLFAVLYPRLERKILHKGDLGAKTLPQLLNVNPWVLIVPVVIILIGLLLLLERTGI